jgi:cobalamin biosynthesis protein CobT
MDQLANEQGNDQYMTIRQGQPIAPSEQEGRALRDEVKRTTSRIRTQLMGLVQASQRVGSRNVRHGKRIDARSLHRLNSGDTRVFRRDTPKPRPNTAVHILVDMSGSMGRAGATGKRRFQVASEASMAIALALEAIHGVNPAVTYFGNDGHAPVYNVVRHGENVSRNAGRFVFYPTGTTPMAEAIWYSGYELVQTREERKMLVVVTDGDPDEAMATQAVIDLCERGDVEVIGIGIGSGAVAQFFKNYVVIEDVSDLQRTLFRLMERSLAASLVA